MVRCSEHGEQEETFVCQHIVETLRDGVARGFFWSSIQTDITQPDALCSACYATVMAAGGDWTPQAEAAAGVRLLCGACYDRAKAINLG